MEQLKSKKLWITIIAGALVTLAEQFGVELDPEQVITFGSIVVAYLTGQSFVDKQKVQSQVDQRLAQLRAEANTIIAALNAQLEDMKAEQPSG